MLGCVDSQSDVQEIVDNLAKAGVPAADVTVVNDTVYLERDIEITLDASREMAETGDPHKEQYHTTNLLGGWVTKICINGGAFTGVLSTALDLAIQNYNEQPLSFSMARTPSNGCSVIINGVIIPGLVGGVSGFPSGGAPFGTINIGGGLVGFDVNTIEHVITHEIGHTIGMRHSDFFNRDISCGSGGGGNEGDGGVGATWIPGTPPGAVVGGSIMNACFRSVETGEFTADDLTALLSLYGAVPQLGAFRTHAVDNRGFGGNIFAENFSYVVGGACSAHFVRTGVPSTQWISQAGGFCAFQNWLNASNPHDCRAMVFAHTGGGFFGGTCLTVVNEAQNSFDFSAANTTSAQVNTVNGVISASAGQTVTIGTCGVTDASANGDTYLRVLDPAGAQVAFNDDACGLGSRLSFTAASSGTFVIRAGCYSSTSCSGTVAWTIE